MTSGPGTVAAAPTAVPTAAATATASASPTPKATAAPAAAPNTPAVPYAPGLTGEKDFVVGVLPPYTWGPIETPKPKVPEGFTPIFNGVNLTGWHPSRTNLHGTAPHLGHPAA